MRKNPGTFTCQILKIGPHRAAKKDVSVSRFLADILKQRMAARDGYAKAMRRALARKPFLKTDGHYLSREEAHDRSHLR